MSPLIPWFASRRSKNPARKNRLLRGEALESRTLMSVSNPLPCPAVSESALYGAIHAGVAVATPVALGDNADTAIQNGSSTYYNFGKNKYMAVGEDTTRGTEAQAYLRFDLGGAGATANSAVLNLSPLSWSSNSTAVALRVRLVPDAGDGWTEGTNGYNRRTTGPMTWANAPAGSGAEILVPASAWPSTGPLSIDVTSLLNQSFNTNGIATFQIDLVSSAGTQAWIYFATRENATAAYRPTLTFADGGSNAAPTVATAASASPSTVTGTTTALKVLGADDGGEGNLTYTWSILSMPNGAAAPTFNVKGSNAAKNATATFKKAGTYAFAVKIADAGGLSVTSDVTVDVSSTLSGIAITPASATLLLGATQQFVASAVDQFGVAMASQPAFTWKTTAGTITASGLFTAPNTAGSATITATAGALQATTTVAVGSSPLGLKDAALENLTETLFVDGSINRQDMIQILRSAGSDDGTVDATEFTDLKTLLTEATTLKIPDYVQVLAGDVVKGNTANAHFQGKTLGNLAAGSSSTQLNELVDKWFLGADHPTALSGTTYRSTAGSLFVNGVSHLDEFQGQLGDCYLISSLGSIADTAPSAIQNMFVDNGDGTFTVRFYSKGVADYVTVDKSLPSNSSGRLVYANMGRSYTDASNELWIPLLEKAYAQWNETGKEGRDGRNVYSSIEGGWMADVYAQALGHAASTYNVSTTSDQNALISAMNNHLAVTIGTKQSSASNDSLSYGLYGSHAYAVTGYNSANGTFTLYNPWGSNQPTGPLTWDQLKATCDGFAVADASGTTPINAGVSRPLVVIAAPVLPFSQYAAAGMIGPSLRIETATGPSSLPGATVTSQASIQRAEPFADEAFLASLSREHRETPPETIALAVDESLRQELAPVRDELLLWGGETLSGNAPALADANAEV